MLTIYTKNNCPYCTQAKQLLESRGLSYQEVDIDVDDSAYQKLVSLNLRSVPQIFENDELFVSGGYQGLVNKLRQLDQDLGQL